MTTTRLGFMAKGTFLAAMAARGAYDGVTNSIDAYANFKAGNYGQGFLNVIATGGSFFELGAAIKGQRGLKALRFPTPVGKGAPQAAANPFLACGMT